MSKITGFTTDTPKKLLLDSGAFFKNYDLTKAYSAQTAGTLIGATQGGGSFAAVPTVRKMEVDGAGGNVKGLQTIDDWAVTMTANVKEITADNLKLALGAAATTTMTTGVQSGSTKIVGKSTFADADYSDNITWVGKLSGSDTPVIIVIKNALCINGLNLTVADKAEATVSVVLTGHYTADDLETPPFEIYYPTVS